MHYIRFIIQEDKNFEDLKFVFSLLKEAKNKNKPEGDSFWLHNFPDYALEKFSFLDNDLKPGFKTAEANDLVWHFYSLIDLLQINYEIEYINCSKISENEGLLNYNSYSYPYGGIEGLIMFISSFGCHPTIVDDGTGVYKINNKDFGVKQRSPNKLFGSLVFLHKFVNFKKRW